MRISTPLRSIAAGVGARAPGDGLASSAPTPNELAAASAASIKERKIKLRAVVIVISPQDRSPHGAKRNAGGILLTAAVPDFASLHPGQTLSSHHHAKVSPARPPTPQRCWS